ncbi:Helix-turn-helix domain-containing protein [Arenibacter nanhaiticus]|uniref:Helix-turn-helix domain-containing protein n=1 Tax=Arenibacter nanhaiticus TaxID=558155 RepID=A0A1M6G8M9_9FLAO|nr:nickel-binding protein [Arenibacter nanhaiticus]SHJ06177.1 Helix-turn-helix domain-containing protein [Arenibacter nanhaiticus]
MPIFMDRHDVSDTVTAEHVARLHQEDLKVEHKYGCRGLTYWFDEKRKTAFCLVEAPNKEALEKMHIEAHGDVPYRIIEVEETIVESFLGRIEDPLKAINKELNIINDPAFRIVMVTGFKTVSFPNILSDGILQSQKKINEAGRSIIESYQGRIVKQQQEGFLVSFCSVSKAVLCSLELQTVFKKITENIEAPHFQLKIGLTSGVPVADKGEFFGDSIRLAERICEIAKGTIAITAEVRNLYESENINGYIAQESVQTLQPSDEKFLNSLMDYTEKIWQNTNVRTTDFNTQLGFSKTQFYRKLVQLTDDSPNVFLKKYRLLKSLGLLKNRSGNISEIAFETGFNSPAYFSKCFLDSFGILPSQFLRYYAVQT